MFLLLFLLLLVQLPVLVFTVTFFLSTPQALFFASFDIPTSSLIYTAYNIGGGPRLHTRNKEIKVWSSTPVWTMEGISVVSLNVNGLNITSKRHILLDHIRRSKADVTLLQETHATGETENYGSANGVDLRTSAMVFRAQKVSPSW